jgi:hypothetical protein
MFGVVKADYWESDWPQVFEKNRWIDSLNLRLFFHDSNEVFFLWRFSWDPQFTSHIHYVTSKCYRRIWLRNYSSNYMTHIFNISSVCTWSTLYVLCHGSSSKVPAALYPVRRWVCILQHGSETLPNVEFSRYWTGRRVWWNGQPETLRLLCLWLSEGACAWCGVGWYCATQAHCRNM